MIAMMKNNYTIYHLHSYDSLLDSATSPEDYINRAVECGMKAICFTEHGNVFNWFHKYELCKENNLKYLYVI